MQNILFWMPNWGQHRTEVQLYQWNNLFKWLLLHFITSSNLIIPWRRKWQPTPVFLPEKFHGQRSLWATVHGVTENQTRLSDQHFRFHCISCLHDYEWRLLKKWTASLQRSLISIPISFLFSPFPPKVINFICFWLLFLLFLFERYVMHYYVPKLGQIPWRREWQPTPGFLPGESHGQRSLAGYSPWSCKESDMTEQLTQTFFRSTKGLKKFFFTQISFLKSSFYWCIMYVLKSTQILNVQHHALKIRKL